MKRCPTCRKTFDDSMQFCQADGIPLVEDKAPNAAGAMINDDDADLLQLNDESETMIASGNRNSGGGNFGGEINFDDLDEDFGKDKQAASSPASDFGSQAKSSFDNSQVIEDAAATPPPQTNLNSFSNDFSSNQTPFETPSPAVSSPIETPPPSVYQPPSFQEPEQANQPNFGAPQSPFNQPVIGQPLQPQWTPPPAPEANWQSQNISANTPFQPPAVIGQAQNQTLPIISLVCGILGFVAICCYGGIPLGIVALVTGYLGLQNVNKDSINFGGKTMAIVGMALGAAALLLNIIFIILGIAVGTLGNLSR